MALNAALFCLYMAGIKIPIMSKFKLREQNFWRHLPINGEKKDKRRDSRKHRKMPGSS